MPGVLPRAQGSRQGTMEEAAELLGPMMSELSIEEMGALVTSLVLQVPTAHMVCAVGCGCSCHVSTRGAAAGFWSPGLPFP